MSEQEDRLLKCGDCGRDFLWTAREQEFFRERDFPPPKRCKECRQANRQRFSGQQAGEDQPGAGKGNREAVSNWEDEGGRGAPEERRTQ